MVRRKWSKYAIRPKVCQERSEGLLEVEGDREVVGRDVCGTDQVQPQDADGSELGIAPESPGEIHIMSIVGLPVRPHQTGSQVERPGGRIGAHPPFWMVGTSIAAPGWIIPCASP